jgi:succinate-semialdehyde dehydrogenase/glutarate-semialdehyde dehydrogenase
MTFQTLNPATGELIQAHAMHSPAQLEHMLDQAVVTAQSWRHVAPDERAHLLHAVAARLRADTDRFARAITLEVGKPITESAAEVRKCATVCDYYASHGPGFLTPQPTQIDAAQAWIQLDPLGVILAIMPWNFPFWQVFRCAAPALMAGNVVLLKHAESVPLCASLLAQVFREAGFPTHAFDAPLIDLPTTSLLIQDPRIAGVALTGSERAGVSVAQAASLHPKPLVLELGSNDPFIVLADADLPLAAALAARSRTLNCGQSCIAAKRFIVESSVHAEFVQHLTTQLLSLRVGDPTDPATQVGPMARADLRAQLHAQVTASIDAGARLMLGGQVPEGPGSFYPPTLLDRVPLGCPAADEELFGPVAAVFVAQDPNHALRLANDSRFGLGATICTRDLRLATAFASQLNAGVVAINDMVRSDPRLPFGGVKASGYGRELGRDGIRAFANIKSVYIGATD